MKRNYVKKIVSLVLCIVMLCSIMAIQTVPVVSAAEAWQDAYAKFLRDTNNRLDSYGDNVRHFFALRDLDGNGIPELIIGYDGRPMIEMYKLFAIYKYDNGKVVKMDRTGNDGGPESAVELFLPVDNSFNGIFYTDFGGGWSFCQYLYVKDGKLVIENMEYSDSQKTTTGKGNIYEQYLLTQKGSPASLEFYDINEANIDKIIYGVKIPENPHYYSTALQEYAKDVDKIAAFLIDLDNDSFDEMVVFVEGKNGNRNNFICDIENGKNIKVEIDNIIIDGQDYVYGYISNTNYLITGSFFDTGDSPGRIMEYKNGKLIEHKLEHIFDVTPQIYYYNGQKISKTQYDEYCKKFGVGNIKLNLGKDIWTKNDIAKILAMTAPPKSITAKPTASKVLVNGKERSFDAYNINDNNYFKLRDLAYVLNGTNKQFEVSWDGKNNAISITTSKKYTAVGGEMKVNTNKENKSATPTTAAVYLNGKKVDFTAYNIDGNNYFKLRDIMKALDVYVGWDGATSTITLDTSKGYVD